MSATQRHFTLLPFVSDVEEDARAVVVDIENPLKTIFESLSDQTGWVVQNLYSKLGARIIESQAIRDGDRLYISVPPCKAADASELVMFRVGTREYLLLRRTVEKCLDAKTVFFKKLFEADASQKFPKDEDGMFVLEIDFGRLDILLYYIRTGEAIFGWHNLLELHDLLVDALRFGLHSLVPHIEAAMLKSDFVYFNERGVLFGTTRPTFLNCPNNSTPHSSDESPCAEPEHSFCLMCQTFWSTHKMVEDVPRYDLDPPTNDETVALNDRHPTFFRMILRFHETSQLEIPEDPRDMVTLIDELKFWKFCKSTQKFVSDIFAEAITPSGEGRATEDSEARQVQSAEGSEEASASTSEACAAPVVDSFEERQRRVLEAQIVRLAHQFKLRAQIVHEESPLSTENVTEELPPFDAQKLSPGFQHFEAQTEHSEVELLPLVKEHSEALEADHCEAQQISLVMENSESLEVDRIADHGEAQQKPLIVKKSEVHEVDVSADHCEAQQVPLIGETSEAHEMDFIEDRPLIVEKSEAQQATSSTERSVAKEAFEVRLRAKQSEADASVATSPQVPLNPEPQIERDGSREMSSVVEQNGSH